ncbi:MAG: nucleotidyltransferase domain-containing protein [Deltaproteobacteria bacterium]|nr:nucleotidyltransferase domain-containing protein [Deltaproteobacteria bacterium]
MKEALDADLALRLSSEAKGAGVDVLVLFGSRARGQARPDSDWDFGFLTQQDIDLAGLTNALARLTGAEQVDLVDLNRANGLLRYLVAAEGVLVYERRTGAFMDFREAAVQFWCDAGPVLARAYEDVLADLRAS